MKHKGRMIILFLFMIILGTTVFLIYEKQEMFQGERIKNPDFYSLVFQKMNQEDSHTLFLKEQDALAVEFSITRGTADLSIGNEKEEIYHGDRIDSGAFEVIIPEDGAYTITVKARHAAGMIRIGLQE